MDSKKNNFIKQDRKPNKLINNMFRKIFGAGMSFYNEIVINEILNENNYDFLSHPRLIEANFEDNKLIFNEIKGVNLKKEKFDRFKQKKLIKSLIELQFSDVNMEKLKRKLILFVQKRQNPMFRTLKNLLKFTLRSKELLLSLKLLIILFSLTLKQKRLKDTILIHNDLAYNNIMINEHDHIYIIDYENAVIERKWILHDIIWISLKKYGLNLDGKFINQYLHYLGNFCENKILSKLNIKAQFRMILIKRSLRTIVKKKDLEDEHYQFLVNILSNNDKFTQWFNKLDIKANEGV